MNARETLEHTIEMLHSEFNYLEVPGVKDQIDTYGKVSFWKGFVTGIFVGIIFIFLIAI